jgi:aminoglycoside phosphotransferase family enzyme
MKIINFNTLSKLSNTSPKFEQKLVLFIRNNSKIFYHRINQFKIRDIHGDLYLKNIYLYDRIENNDSLRPDRF